MSLQDVLKSCAKSKRVDEYISAELFFTVSFELNIAIIKIIKDYGISKTFIKQKLKQLNVSAMYFSDEDNNKRNFQNENQTNKTKSKTPILDNFGRDLTALANDDKLDPIIGRDSEVERVAQILTRRKKNNPVLIGDPGVGKTAIAEGLAIKIAKNECPRPLQGKRLVTLDLTSMVAGTKYRGQFEERIKGLLDEVRDNPNIILFVDELHTLVGAGNSSGSLDAANVFKPALARGEVQCIGATTLDEYREHIEKDGALDRRFQKVIVNPPTLEQTKEILMNIREKYQDFHKVEYTDDAIDEIIRLSDRYITNREFPDKAIDILDEAGSRTQVSIKPPQKIKELEDSIKEIKKQKSEVVKSQNYEKAADLRDLEKKTTTELEKETKIWKDTINTKRMVVTDEMICEVVSMMTGIPISKISQNEIKKLINIDKEISNTVIGQDEAIQKVASAIKRNRTGIRRQNRPIGSFLFIGPTGVGKTELAKVLAENVDITILGNPTRVNTLDKYIASKPKLGEMFSIVAQGAPAPVKAAIKYNDLLAFWKLDRQHSKIVQGDKVKWIYLKDNPYKIEALAFLDFDMPDKIRTLLAEYADKNKSFETILESKLQGFYSDLGWDLNLNPYRNLFFNF